MNSKNHIFQKKLPASFGVYWQILPKQQYFSIHSLGRKSGLHPHAENIDNAPAIIQTGKKHDNTLFIEKR